MAPPFPLSDRATDVRPGCKTQRIAPTLRQIADLVCARTKEREYLKTCIVGHVNCCLQCGSTLNQQGHFNKSGPTQRHCIQCGKKDNETVLQMPQCPIPSRLLC
ncbi:hypothetical protein PoB_000643200 [Plakobranchus ocellatus]|uniref:Uncharacterized protein n=1 Tax=Plakobranchus ocellatus TaxID=259542 RepID=A0AAV3YCU8_9GAST|nr:hypothetical protein PoB_000643200 [Plakobranchus ocellatus]